ncbi:aspartate--tRNA ligase [bacterium]|nr:aspartate--tRNA ligase [bacterium]
MTFLKRTHTCGELRLSENEKTVVLNGWVNKRRDLGGVIFLDLRDRFGITQVVINPENVSSDFYEKAKTIRSEFVIAVCGKVGKRPEIGKNTEMLTREIEVYAEQLEILSVAEVTPFEISNCENVSEELKLKYRYLELRTQKLKENLVLRSEYYSIVRNYFNSLSFVEVETPILMKSTPEGARDFLVPSRIHHGKFYALPQSPQTYKQLLMIGGIDKYFQIVKCFRDEDLRADRQPEFSQVDVEMSFVEEIDLQNLTEGLMNELFKVFRKKELELPLQRITYKEAMRRFGSDKPDLRFGMELIEITQFVKNSDFEVFKNAETVTGFCVKGGEIFSRKKLDELTDYAKKFKAKGLAYIKIGEEIVSPIKKYLSEEVLENILSSFDAQKGDLILLVADKESVAQTCSGALRLKVAKDLNLIDESKDSIFWVVEFPLLEFSEEENRYVACHHPFTAPLSEDVFLMETSPEKVRARAYDLVWNGNEVAGGSIRIHQNDVQRKLFDLIGLTEEEAREKFGFFLDALKFGTPPHGGIAFGLDRQVALFCGVEQIRDVIAFPKTVSASSLMDGSPSTVTEEQLGLLGLELKQKTT